MKRLIAATAALLGAVIHARAEAASPVGAWEVTVLGADRGTVRMTFEPDMTLSGYGITLKQFGLFALSGHWGYDAKSNVVVAFVQSLDGVDIAASFTARFVGNNRWRGKGSWTASGRTLRLKGELPTDSPDLSGQWVAELKQRGNDSFEQYQLSAVTNFPGLFDLDGEGIGNTGSYEVSGSVLVNSRNRLNAFIRRERNSTGTGSSLFGRFKPGDETMRLTGVDDAGRRLTLEAERR
jgi:hypothetical protein